VADWTGTKKQILPIGRIGIYHVGLRGNRDLGAPGTLLWVILFV